MAEDKTLGAYNIFDLRDMALKRVPKGLFEFVDRGTEVCVEAIAEVMGVEVRRDEKVLAGWNGLMLRAMAEAARRIGSSQSAVICARC